jgi:hypothetical protein
MTTTRKHDDQRPPIPATDPLWGLTCVLGDIAVRVTRRRAAEQAGETVDERRPGLDPLGRGGDGR